MILAFILFHFTWVVLPWDCRADFHRFSLPWDYKPLLCWCKILNLFFSDSKTTSPIETGPRDKSHKVPRSPRNLKTSKSAINVLDFNNIVQLGTKPLEEPAFPVVAHSGEKLEQTSPRLIVNSNFGAVGPRFCRVIGAQLGNSSPGTPFRYATNQTSLHKLTFPQVTQYTVADKDVWCPGIHCIGAENLVKQKLGQTTGRVLLFDN